MEKFEKKIVDGFPLIICSFAAFWFALIAYGLLSQ